jgi:hypothetical protein
VQTRRANKAAPREIAAQQAVILNEREAGNEGPKSPSAPGFRTTPPPARKQSRRHPAKPGVGVGDIAAHWVPAETAHTLHIPAPQVRHYSAQHDPRRACALKEEVGLGLSPN